VNATYTGPLPEVYIPALGITVRQGQTIQAAANEEAKAYRGDGYEVQEFPIDEGILAGLLIQGDAWKPADAGAKELLAAVLVASGVFDTDDDASAAEAPAEPATPVVAVPTTKPARARSSKE
jgi:hypothetical protein